MKCEDRVRNLFLGLDVDLYMVQTSKQTTPITAMLHLMTICSDDTAGVNALLRRMFVVAFAPSLNIIRN